MRVIAGQARGRRLKVPSTGTRPTSDRVRESLFSSLESRLRASSQLWRDQRVVDLFAGSGALGLEAMSRGAHSVVFVEKSASACTVIRENCAVVGVDPHTCLSTSVEKWLANPQSHDDDFTLAFLDPPYSMARNKVEDVLVRLCARLAPAALVVVERARGDVLTFPTPIECIDERSFGETTLWYGRYSGGLGSGPHDGTEVEFT